MASEPKRRRFLSAVLLLALGLTPIAASAGTPTAAERETARRLMDEGKARMRANDVVRAIDALQKAHEIMHVPTTGLALAKAHVAAGHLVEARDVALEVVRIPHEAGEPNVFETARKQARDLETQLKPRIPTLRIRIRGTAAKVAVDDVEIPPAIIGEPVAVNPGKRVVSARSAEGGEVKGEIEINEREVREIELTLPQHGEAGTVTTGPNANATISSSPPPPKTDKPLSLGSVPERAGDRTPLALGLMYGGAAVGALGLVVGIVAGALTFSKAGDVRTQCENNICAPEARDDLDSATTLGTVSTIGFAVGAAGAITGVIGFLLPRKSATRIGFTAHGIGGTF
jgi:hypothetical protein